MPILTDGENKAQKVQGGELFKYKSSDVISLLNLKPSHGLQTPDYGLKVPQGIVTVGSPDCFSHLLTIPYILWPLFIPETYQDHSHIKAFVPAVPSAWNVLPFLDRTDFSLLDFWSNSTSSERPTSWSPLPLAFDLTLRTTKIILCVHCWCISCLLPPPLPPSTPNPRHHGIRDSVSCLSYSLHRLEHTGNRQVICLIKEVLGLFWWSSG